MLSCIPAENELGSSLPCTKDEIFPLSAILGISTFDHHTSARLILPPPAHVVDLMFDSVFAASSSAHLSLYATFLVRR